MTRMRTLIARARRRRCRVTTKGVPQTNRIRRSLGRAGTCYGNAVAESFFASYKKGLIRTRLWPNLASVRKATFERIEMHYNPTLRHSTLCYLTPEGYALKYRHIHERAA